MTRPTVSQLGRYRIAEELGRGAMGIVYKAHDPALNRVVAVKTILIAADAEGRAEYEARFFQEAKAAARLNHPNIITVYDAGREGDMAYMAMELLEGTDLRDLMKRGALPLSLSLDLAIQVADALAYAHDHEVIHRDIKPANIMVIRERQAKIMDFGIARIRLSDVRTATGALMGSPKYMSPEQVSGQRADHRSDIFSLGITLYEMLTTQVPYSAEDLAQLMYQVSMTPAEPPSVVNPSLPTMLDLIIGKALEKAPDARYQSAAELAADLRSCRQQAAAAADRPAPAQGNVDLALEATAFPTVPALDTGAARTLTSAPPLFSGPVPTFQLSLSRRFASSAALARFDSPRGHFLHESVRRLERLRRDPYRREMTVIISVAVALAVLIAVV